jgi:hypothetical protein
VAEVAELEVVVVGLVAELEGVVAWDEVTVGVLVDVAVDVAAAPEAVGTVEREETP